jgi:hypothetical protein
MKLYNEMDPHSYFNKKLQSKANFLLTLPFSTANNFALLFCRNCLNVEKHYMAGMLRNTETMQIWLPQKRRPEKNNTSGCSAQMILLPNVQHRSPSSSPATLPNACPASTSLFLPQGA